MEREKGSLTVEASVSITAFMFIVLLILGMSKVYQAQSLVSHATLQASQSLAIESHYRETFAGNDTLTTVSTLSKYLSKVGVKSATVLDEWYASLGAEETDFYKILKDKFIYAIAEDRDAADARLRSLGVKDGLDGIDFSQSCIDSSDIIVHVRYDVVLPFSFFGDELELSLSKSAKAKAFKSIDKDRAPAVSPAPSTTPVPEAAPAPTPSPS